MKKMLVVVVVALFFFSSCASRNLEFLDENLSITAITQENDAHLLIAEDGNCYIRNEWISEEKPYGLKNAKDYRKFISKTFPFSKDLNEFVMLYDGGNAKEARLSYNGGVIITNESDLLLFCNDNTNYSVPTKFASEIIDGKLVDDRVFLIQSDGFFGYRSIENKDTFIPILSDVADFKQTENIFIIRTNKNEIIISDDSFSADQLDKRIEDVVSYSLDCVDCTVDHDIIMTYVKSDGSCFYRRGGRDELSEFQCSELYQKISDTALEASVYRNGVVFIDHSYNACVYGKEFTGETLFEGKIIANNVKSVSGDRGSIFVLLNDGTYIYYGSLINGEYYDFN